MQYILLAFSGERLHPWHDTPLTIWLSKRLNNPMIAPTKKRLAQAFPIYELKITLCGSNPAIWRRVQVPGGIKLNRLHDVLQVVMGWTDSHLHQFRVGSVIYCLPSDDDFYPAVSSVTNDIAAQIQSE